MIEALLALMIVPAIFLLFITFIWFIPKNYKFLNIFYIIQYCLFSRISSNASTVINDIIDMHESGKLTSKLDTCYIHFYHNDKYYCSIYVHGKYYLYGTLTWPATYGSINKGYSPGVSAFLRLIEFERELRNKP